MKKERATLTLSEMQDVLYDILKVFAEFCDKHGLRYYLFGGTLLGAVRHNGFIPWDDDVDVSMPRPDYEKFIELTKNSPWEHYEVKQYTQPFIKLVDTRTVMEERLLKDSLKMESIFIDIFPIDGLSSNLKENKKHFKKIKFYKRLLTYSIVEKRKVSLGPFYKRCIKSVLFAVSSAIGYKTFQQKLEKLAKKYSYSDSEYVGVSIWTWGIKDLGRKEDLEKRVLISFRDTKLWCQGNYVESLTKKYGDYMKLPPEDKRPPFHGICYWKEEGDLK